MRAIVLCNTCRRPDGETLIAHVKAEAEARGACDFEVVEQGCLWNCNRPCSVVFRDSARFSYVTGGHEATREQAVAILDWFAAHGASARGEVPFREWPQRMRGHFIARMPPWR
jgi:predicted metal-binding protein